MGKIPLLPPRAALLAGLLFLGAGNLPAQVPSGPTGAPLSKSMVPRFKTSDPFVAHSDHSFYFKENLTNALLRFTTAPDFKVNDPVCLNDLGYIYFYFGEYGEAAAQFKKALALNPAYTAAAVNLGVASHKVGEDDLALRYLGQVRDSDPARGEALYDLGLIQYERGNYPQAVGYLEEASKVVGSDPKVWNNLGCAYFQVKDFPLAFQAFKTSVANGASFYHAYYNEAVASLLSGNYEEAVEATNRAVRLSPSNPDAYNLLGLAFLFNQNYLRASVALAKAIQMRNNDAGYFNNLGRAQLGLGHYKDAEKMLKRALLFQPDLKPALWNMGDLELRQGRIKQALAHYLNVEGWDEAQGNAVFHYNFGVAYYKDKDPKDARLHWEKARQLDPDYLEPLYGLAVLAHEGKDNETALSLAQQGEVQEPQSSRWPLLVGDLQKALGHPEDSLASFEKARQMGQKDPKLLAKIESLKNDRSASGDQASGTGAAPSPQESWEGMHQLAEKALRTGDLEVGRTLARTETGQWPQDPRSWEDLSRVEEADGKKEEALAGMERALRLAPDNAHYLEECGKLAFEAGKYQVASRYFGLAVKAPGGSWEGALGLGSCSFKLNLYDEAILYWQKGAQEFPDHPEFLYDLGRAHYQKGQVSQAMLYYQKALRMRPVYPEVLTNWAAIDLDADRLDAAEQKLKKSLSQDPRTAETYFNLGTLELKRGYFTDALKYYQQGLEVDPNDANGYYCQGVAFLKLGQWARAQSLLEKTLEKDPNHADALYNLGKVAVEMDDYGSAQRYFDLSLKAKPGQGDAYFGMGLVQFHEGHYKDAQLQFVKAQNDYQVGHEALYYLGRTEEKLGDAASAEAFYRQSLERHPSFGLAHLTLGDLLRSNGRMLEARQEYQKASLQREYPEIAKAADAKLSEMP
ncbi:MAG TPA: tetratricopeptide repeat protein [bacterium]|nr:tetratricopeptide repeat protein [bacterium]